MFAEERADDLAQLVVFRAVAGGGGGFGAATARRLHAAGARIVVSDLDEAKGKAVAGRARSTRRAGRRRRSRSRT